MNGTTVIVMLVLALVAGLAVWGPICGNLARSRGRTFGEGYVLGAFLGLIALVIILCMAEARRFPGLGVVVRNGGVYSLLGPRLGEYAGSHAEVTDTAAVMVYTDSTSRYELKTPEMVAAARAE